MKIKKTLIIVALIHFCLANAQKGTVLVGGFASIRSTENTSNGANQIFNSFELTPKIGYQFSSYWTAGIETTIGTSKSKATAAGISSESKTNQFNIGGFIAYSKQMTGIFYGFTKLTSGLQTQKRFQNDSTLTATQWNGFYIAIEPGIYIDLKKGFGLDFFIGGIRYNTYKNQQNSTTLQKELDFTFGKVLKIGISKNM